MGYKGVRLNKPGRSRPYALKIWVEGHQQHLKSGTTNLSWFRHLSMIQPGHCMPQSEKELPANLRAVDAVSTQQALAAAQAKAAATREPKAATAEATA